MIKDFFNEKDISKMPKMPFMLDRLRSIIGAYWVRQMRVQLPLNNVELAID